MGNKEANFTVSLNFVDEAQAGLIPDEYRNPLLSWVRLVFADDSPNANNQGIGQDEFQNLIQTMSFMPIKANFDPEFGLAGHSEARVIGVIKSGQQEGNQIVAIGAIYNDEYPEVVDYFKKELAEGGSVDFSWEIRYRDSEETDGVEWLKGITTKAVTAVQHPAYEGRTPLVSISAQDMINIIDENIRVRELTEVGQ